MSAKKMLDGKVVIVTGAGRGIGRGIAMALADAGAKVVVNDLGASAGGEGDDTSPATEVVDKIAASGGEAVANFNSVAYSRSPAKSPVKGRPVRLAPFKPGASPTINRRGSMPPNDGTGALCQSG